MGGTAAPPESFCPCFGTGSCEARLAREDVVTALLCPGAMQPVRKVHATRATSAAGEASRVFEERDLGDMASNGF
jgi:hypothetical protein